MIDPRKIIVSLDGISQKKALTIAERLRGTVWGFKVNDLVYDDLDIIVKLKTLGRVFVDAKLHDIPNTVANSVGRLSERGADIITVHASGGIKMMQAAKANADSTKVIAVTVLTSADSKNAGEKVSYLAEDAMKAKLDGVVCSGHDLKTISTMNEMQGKLKIVPGVRPSWYREKDDQVRTVTPHEAIQLGADYLVVGRPITQASDPNQALNHLIGEKI